MGQRFLRETHLRTLFKCEYTHYTSALRNATIQFAESIHAIANLDDVLVNVAISGGLDSRVILAALLSDSIDLDRIDFKTNTHPTRAGDFAVVERLSQRFGFNVNDPDKARNHRRKHSLQLTKMKDRAALWVLSSMGLFDMTYFMIHNTSPLHHWYRGPGAESMKGTFSTHVSTVIKRKWQKKHSFLDMVFGIFVEQPTKVRLIHSNCPLLWHQVVYIWIIFCLIGIACLQISYCKRSRDHAVGIGRSWRTVCSLSCQHQSIHCAKSATQAWSAYADPLESRINGIRFWTFEEQCFTEYIESRLEALGIVESL